MNKRLKNTLIATAVAPAVLAPSVEAAPTLNKRTSQQVRTLGRDIMRLGDGHTAVSVSKDKQGHEKATYHLKLDARSGTPSNDSTSEYDFTLVTTAHGGRPQPQTPRALRISAESHTGKSGEDRVVVDYKLNPRKHTWGVVVYNEHQSQPSIPSPGPQIDGIDGAFWKERDIVPVNPRNAHALPDIFKLAESAIHAASEGQPIGNLPRRHIR